LQTDQSALLKLFSALDETRLPELFLCLHSLAYRLLLAGADPSKPVTTTARQMFKGCAAVMKIDADTGLSLNDSEESPLLTMLHSFDWKPAVNLFLTTAIDGDDQSKMKILVSSVSFSLNHLV
jgi:hypothetical protein